MRSLPRTRRASSLQGGKSPTKNSAADNYLGLVLVDVATGKVMNQQEQHANTHTFKTITWNLKTSRKAKYRLELRDGKSNTGWAHLELQDVRITHTPCNVMQNLGGSGCTAKKKCSECRGDCDSDKDCQTGLKCHQRNNKMKVPGCKSGGKGDANTYDFCYRPQSEATLSARARGAPSRGTRMPARLHETNTPTALCTPKAHPDPAAPVPRPSQTSCSTRAAPAARPRRSADCARATATATRTARRACAATSVTARRRLWAATKAAAPRTT